MSFRESVEIAHFSWDSGASDSVGLSLALIPMTSLWYWGAGVPTATRRAASAERRARGIPASAWMKVSVYAIGLFGVVFLGGVVVAAIVVLV